MKTIAKSESQKPILNSWQQVASRLPGPKWLYWGLLFFGCWALATYGFYLRVPSNYIYPNFYAEDGVTFAKAVMDHGFIGALFTLFNGYFVFGIYFLTEAGMLLNHVIGGGHFVNLPASLAVVSYLFLGFCAALPLLLLRGYMRLPFLLLLVVLLALLPMPSFDATIIGTIGNLKFAFAYIALLLLLYRIKLSPQSNRYFFVDAGLLFCIYTIASSYILLPLLLLCPGLWPWQLLSKSYWRKEAILGNKSLISAVILCAFALVQIIIAFTHSVGRLNSAFQPGEKIEMLVARSYLYPLAPWAYHNLSDIASVIIVIIFVGLVLYIGKTPRRWLYSGLLVSIAFISTLIVTTRPEISIGFVHYQSSGFDNFFYAQNFILLTTVVLLLADSWQRNRQSWPRTAAVIIVSAALLVGYVYTDQRHIPDESMQYNSGTIYQGIEAACSSPAAHISQVSVPIYPSPRLKFSGSRSIWCSQTKPAANWYNFENLGLTAAMPAQTIEFPKAAASSPTQTFRADHDELTGIGLLLINPPDGRADVYELRLLDASCRQTIAQVTLPRYIRGNAYRTISFNPIAHSAGHTYCFSVRPRIATNQFLLLTLSGDNQYPAGQLTIGGKPVDTDILFQPVYR